MKKNFTDGEFLRGSLTVETAMIAPILIVSVFMLLYLAVHVHNRCTLYARAAEQAVSGHEQEDPSYFAMAELKTERSDTQRERKVSYKCGTLYLDGQRLWSIDVEAVYKKYKPVKRLRQMASTKRLFRKKEQ